MRRQPPAARWRLNLLDELRGTPWEHKPGSRGSAPRSPHTSFAPPSAATPSTGGRTGSRSTGGAAEASTAAGGHSGRRHRGSRKVKLSSPQARDSTQEKLWCRGTEPPYDARDVIGPRAQPNPQRDLPSTHDSIDLPGRKLGTATSTSGADVPIVERNRTLRAHVQQLQTLRFDCQERRSGHTLWKDHEQKSANVIGGLEVCAMGDDHDEWLDRPNQLDVELEEDDGGGADRRNVPEHIHRKPFRAHSEEGLDQGNHVAKKAPVKELKHMQDHNVSKVVWLGEIKPIPKVRSKWALDVKRDAVRARFVARQVAYRNRDVCAKTPPPAVARGVGTGSQPWKKPRTGTSACSTPQEPLRTQLDGLTVLMPPPGIAPTWRGLLLRRVLYGTRKASKLWAMTYSKALQSVGWSQSRLFPGTTTCHTVTISLWKTQLNARPSSKQRCAVTSKAIGNRWAWQGHQKILFQTHDSKRWT